MQLNQWEIRAESGEILGEVEAADRAGAVALAEGRWPGRTEGMYVWNQAGQAGIRRKLERKALRLRPRLAHHEAGHAVLARRLGFGVELVSVKLRMNETAGRFDPEGDSLGRTVTKPGDNRDRRTPFERVSDRALYVLGGPMAESRYLGRPRWADLRGRSLNGSDAEAFAEWSWIGAQAECGCLTAAGAARDPDHHARCVVIFRRRLKSRAAAELNACWCEVEAVAAALQERLELDEDELDRIRSMAQSSVEAGAARQWPGVGTPGSGAWQRRGVKPPRGRSLPASEGRRCRARGPSPGSIRS